MHTVKVIMAHDYFYVFIFFIFGIFFVISILLVSRWLKPSSHEPAQLLPYECGEESTGSLWNKVTIHFYPVAFIFLIFQVALVFLYLWAVIFKQSGVSSFIKILIFIGIIVIGFIYAWGKGDLEVNKK